jgi:ABC-type multidrug transport system permease subunit
MTVNQSPYFATLYSCTSPYLFLCGHLFLGAFAHAQLSVISGESPAFYPPSISSKTNVALN